VTQLEQDFEELKLDPERLKWVCRNSGQYERLFIADHTTDPQILEVLAEKDNVWFPIAENPYTPPHVLVRISQCPDDGVRYAVSKNPNAPPLVRMWLQSGKYGGMSLEDFLEETK
jgi:hypothetical protein